MCNPAHLTVLHFAIILNVFEYLLFLLFCIMKHPVEIFIDLCLNLLCVIGTSLLLLPSVDCVSVVYQ